MKKRGSSKGIANIDLGLSDDDDDGAFSKLNDSRTSRGKQSNDGSFLSPKGNKGGSSSKRKDKDESIEDLLASKDSALMFGGGGPPRKKNYGGLNLFGGASSLGSGGGDPLDCLAQEVMQRKSTAVAPPSDTREPEDDEELEFQLRLQRELGLAGVGDDSIASGAEVQPQQQQYSTPAPREDSSDGDLDSIMGDILDDDDDGRSKVKNSRSKPPLPGRPVSPTKAPEPTASRGLRRIESNASLMSSVPESINPIESDRGGSDAASRPGSVVASRPASRQDSVVASDQGGSVAGSRANSVAASSRAGSVTESPRAHSAVASDLSSIRGGGFENSQRLDLDVTAAKALLSGGGPDDSAGESDWDAESDRSDRADEQVESEGRANDSLMAGTIADSHKSPDVSAIGASRDLLMTPDPVDVELRLDAKPTRRLSAAKAKAAPKQETEEKGQSVNASVISEPPDLDVELKVEAKPKRRLGAAKAKAAPSQEVEMNLGGMNASERAVPPPDDADGDSHVVGIAGQRSNVEEQREDADSDWDYSTSFSNKGLEVKDHRTDLPSGQSLSNEHSGVPQSPSHGSEFGSSGRSRTKRPSVGIAGGSLPPEPDEDACEPELIQNSVKESSTLVDEEKDLPKDEESDWDASADQLVEPQLAKEREDLKGQAEEQEQGSENGDSHQQHTQGDDRDLERSKSSCEEDVEDLGMKSDRTQPLVKSTLAEESESPSGMRELLLSSDTAFDVELKVEAKPKRCLGKAKAQPKPLEVHAEQKEGGSEQKIESERSAQLEERPISSSTPVGSHQGEDGQYETGDSDWDSESPSEERQSNSDNLDTDKQKGVRMQERQPSEEGTSDSDRKRVVSRDERQAEEKESVVDEASFVNTSEDQAHSVSPNSTQNHVITESKDGTSSAFSVELSMEAKPKRRLGKAKAQPAQPTLSKDPSKDADLSHCLVDQNEHAESKVSVSRGAAEKSNSREGSSLIEDCQALTNPENIPDADKDWDTSPEKEKERDESQIHSQLDDFQNEIHTKEGSPKWLAGDDHKQNKEDHIDDFDDMSDRKENVDVPSKPVTPSQERSDTQQSKKEKPASIASLGNEAQVIIERKKQSRVSKELPDPETKKETKKAPPLSTASLGSAPAVAEAALSLADDDNLIRKPQKNKPKETTKETAKSKDEQHDAALPSHSKSKENATASSQGIGPSSPLVAELRLDRKRENPSKESKVAIGNPDLDKVEGLALPACGRQVPSSMLVHSAATSPRSPRTPRTCANQVPTAPDAPSIEVVEDKQVRISWAAMPRELDVIGYGVAIHDGVLKYYDADSGTLTTCQTNASPVTADVTSVLVKGLADGTRCKAEVAFMNKLGWSQYSQPSKSLVLAPPSAPQTPMLEVVGVDSFRVSWSLLQETKKPPVKGYAITIVSAGVMYYVDAFTGTLSLDSEGLSPATAETDSIVVRGISPLVWHAAAVAAQNDVGWGSYSQFCQEVAIELPPTPLRPTLEAIGSDSIRVSWTRARHTPKITGYGMLVIADERTFTYFDAKSGCLVASAEDAKHIAPSAASATLHGLRKGVQYKVRIAAMSDIGWGRYSSPSEMLSLNVPAAPKTVTIEVFSSDSICVRWVAAPDAKLPLRGFALTVYSDGFVGYYDSRTQKIVDDRESARSLDASSNFALVKGLAPGVKYKARVASKNEIGWGTYSASSRPALIEEPPQMAPPTCEVLDNTSIRVAWTPVPAGFAAVGYGVVVSDGVTLRYYDAHSQTLVDNRKDCTPVRPDITSTVIQGLGANITYKAKVSAKNGVDWGRYSEWSDLLKIQVPPQLVAPDVRVLESGTVRVTWKLVEHVPPVTGYMVAAYDGTIRYYDALEGKLCARAKEARPVTGATQSVAIKGLRNGTDYKFQVAAINEVGSGQFSPFTEPIMVGETDDMRLWPVLPVDLAPRAPLPRKLQSSQFFAKALNRKEDIDESLIDSCFASMGDDGAVYNSLRQNAMDRAEAAVVAWLNRDVEASPIFRRINNVLLRDDEEEVEKFVPILEHICAFIVRNPPKRTRIMWRGSKLTRTQVRSLRAGEIIRPPMFVSIVANEHLAERFRDVYLIRFILHGKSRNAGIVRDRSGSDEIVLLPYSQVRVLAIRDDDVIEVEVLDAEDIDSNVARAFPI